MKAKTWLCIFLSLILFVKLSQTMQDKICRVVTLDNKEEINFCFGVPKLEVCFPLGYSGYSECYSTDVENASRLADFATREVGRIYRQVRREVEKEFFFLEIPDLNLPSPVLELSIKNTTQFHRELFKEIASRFVTPSLLEYNPNLRHIHGSMIQHCKEMTSYGPKD